MSVVTDWLTAIGTCGAVIFAATESVRLSWKEKKRLERRPKIEAGYISVVTRKTDDGRHAYVAVFNSGAMPIMNVRIGAVVTLSTTFDESKLTNVDLRWFPDEGEISFWPYLEPGRSVKCAGGFYEYEKSDPFTDRKVGPERTADIADDILAMVKWTDLHSFAWQRSENVGIGPERIESEFGAHDLLDPH
jgi:hypothetical protein